MAFAKPDRDIKVPVEKAPAKLLDDPPQLSIDEHNGNTTKTKSTTVVLHHDHINQMPVEILHAIFLLVQTVSLYDPFSRNETGVGHTFIHNRNPPLSISQVCRYWRACALAMKELWRHIYVCDEHVLAGELVALFLKRSSPLPISFLHHTINEKSPTSTPVAMEGYYEAINANYDSIQQSHVRSRLCSISFHTNKSILLQPVWALLTGPLPNVVEVDIRFSHFDDIDDEGGLIHPEMFLHLLQDCASRIRRLSLINGRYDYWLDDRFDGLVELHLTERMYTLVEFDSFISVLETIGKTLEVLCLRNAVPYPYVPFEMGVHSLIPDDDDQVKMPKLRHLEIWGDPNKERSPRSPSLELFLLWILDIPHTAAIVWEADISMNDAFVTWKYNIPPKPHLARITSLVTSAYKESCFAIAGSTFYLDPRKVDADDLESWISILPNFESGTT